MTSHSLPDPADRPEADVVIFDGQCRFCIAGIRQLRRLDITGRLAYLSLHDPRTTDWYPDLTHDELMRQMYVIPATPDGGSTRHEPSEPHGTGGRRYGGSEAVKYLSRRLPLLWLVMPILHLPGTAGLYRRIYAAVARHRYRIAGKMGDSCDDVCALHFGKTK